MKESLIKGIAHKISLSLISLSTIIEEMTYETPRTEIIEQTLNDITHDIKRIREYIKEDNI